MDDEETLFSLVHQVLKENPREVERYLRGKTRLFSFFMGQIMSKTRGKADPTRSKDLLERTLRTLRSD